MKTFLLAPDSFKGTLTAPEVCAIEARAIRARFPGAAVRALPMADGGEGLVDACLRLMGGEPVTAAVTGPFGEPVEAVYGLLSDGSAVIEMAAAAGLPLAAGREDPLRATTRGVGELMVHACRRGAKKLLLGLGGSCTNDCGTGMAAALGFRFLDEGGSEVEPLAWNLARVAAIVPPERLPWEELRAACDVDNPLLGKRGATYTFGPQKGADAAALERLEAGMTHFAGVLEAFSGTPGGTETPGSGAAGGMGAAVRLLLGGELLPGAELLLDCAGFDRLLKEAGLVITGEGRMDRQSAYGKVPGAVARRCKAAGVPCVALCGAIGEGAEELYTCGVTAMFSAVRGAASFPDIQKSCREDLFSLTDAVLRLLEI